MTRRVFLIITIVLILINITIIFLGEMYERRLARLLSVVVYFVFFMAYKGYKQTLVFAAIMLLMFVDIIGLDFESSSLTKLGPIIKLAVYFLLIRSVFKRLNISKVKRLIGISFAIVIALNIYMLYRIVWSDFLVVNDNIERIIYLFYGIAILGTCIGAANYHFRYSTNRSLYFFYTIYFLVISDAAWFIAYYLGFSYAFYVDLFFYLIAFYYMFCYALHTKEQEDDKVKDMMKGVDF